MPKRNELRAQKRQGTDTTCTSPNERSQSETATYCAIPILGHSGKGQTIETVKRSAATTGEGKEGEELAPVQELGVCPRSHCAAASGEGPCNLSLLCVRHRARGGRGEEDALSPSKLCKLPALEPCPCPHSACLSSSSFRCLSVLVWGTGSIFLCY